MKVRKEETFMVEDGYVISLVGLVYMAAVVSRDHCRVVSFALPKKGERAMADAIIFRRRGSGGGGPESNPAANISGGTQSNTGNWWTAIFTSNGWFKAGQAKGNQYYVMAFGGGSGGGNWTTCMYGSSENVGWCGGGGGCMNRGTITLTPNTNISITIGSGATCNGRSSAVGGSTSFGTYISAAGANGCYVAYPFNEMHFMSGGGGSSGGLWLNASKLCYGQSVSAFYNTIIYINSRWEGEQKSAQYGGTGGIWTARGAWDERGRWVNYWIDSGGNYGGSGGFWIASTSYPWEVYISTISAYNLSNASDWVQFWGSAKSSYGGLGSNRGSGGAGTTCSNSGWRYPNGVWMNGTSSGGSYGGGGGGYGSKGGSWGGGGGGWCANGGNYGGGGGGFGINGYGGDNGGGGGAYGRGGGPAGGALYGGGGWGKNAERGANGIVIVQWYSN